MCDYAMTVERKRIVFPIPVLNYADSFSVVYQRRMYWLGLSVVGGTFHWKRYLWAHLEDE